MIIDQKNITNEIIARMHSEIFIYPTDTIYGIGCDATNEDLVKRIREIKNRDNKPLSIIAPSVEWILKNFEVNLDEIERYLPGPYTLLLRKNKKNFLNWISDNEFIGVRIPNCSFTKILQSLEVPIVTTSVNLSGEPFALEIGEIDERILNRVDLIIEGANLSGEPSKLIIEGKEIKR